MERMIQYSADQNNIFSEYNDEIFEYMRELQNEVLIDPNYMVNKQKDTCLNWENRSKLILWLIEINDRYSLRQEIIFLTVNYLDRFLSIKEVSTDKLQLTGLVALNLAIKYEGGQRFCLEDLQYLSEDKYEAETFRKAEIFMLQKLRYELGWPGPLIFVRRINEIDKMEATTRALTEYFLEAILLDKRFVAERPSITAAATYCLARCMLGMGEWTSLHVRTSEFNYSQLYPLMIKILEWLNQSQNLYLEVYDKYCLPQNLTVASLVKKKLKSGFVIDSGGPDSSSNQDFSSALDSSPASDSGWDSESSSDSGSSSGSQLSSGSDSNSASGSNSDSGWDSESSSDSQSSSSSSSDSESSSDSGSSSGPELSSASDSNSDSGWDSGSNSGSDEIYFSN